MSYSVKVLIFVVGWLILFALIRPLALLVLILFPVVWLVSLPLRLVGMAIGPVLAVIRTVWVLPARLLGFRKHKCGA